MKRALLKEYSAFFILMGMLSLLISGCSDKKDNLEKIVLTGEFVVFVDDPFAQTSSSSMTWRSASDKLYDMTLFFRAEDKFYAVLKDAPQTKIKGALNKVRLGQRVRVEGILLEGEPVNLRPSDYSGALALIKMDHLESDKAQNPNVESKELVRDIVDEIEAISGGSLALINTPDENGDYPIHKVSITSDLYLLQALLRMGADPNAKDSEGNTALLKILTENKESLSDEQHHTLFKKVNLLLDFRANPTIGNDQGVNPMILPIVIDSEFRHMFRDYLRESSGLK